MKRTLMSAPRWPWLALCCLAAASAASPRFDLNWSRLPAGTEIPELRTANSRTFSNGDGTFTADITPGPCTTRGERARSSYKQADSEQMNQPLSTGQIQYQVYHGIDLYFRDTPELSYVYDYGVVTRVAYAKFELTPIPDSSRIMSAEFHYYQRQYAGTVETRITYAAIDPDSTSNEQVFLAVRDGSALAERSHPGIGWVVQTLNSDGIAHLSECMSQGWMMLGVRPLAASGTAYGITGDSLQTYLHIVYVGPYESDIQAVRAGLPTYPAVVGTADTALVVLTNKGLHTSDQFRAYANSPGHAPESTLVGMIAVGETVSVMLPLPAPDSANTFVDCRLWWACPNDPYPANDTTQLKYWVFPAGTYEAAGFDEPEFPPPGWVIVNNDSGNQCWERRTDEGMSHSGAGFTSRPYEQSVNNDDWIISGPIYPMRRDPDSVAFFCRAYQGPPGLNLQVWALRGQTVADRILDLASLGIFDTIYHRWSVPLDRFDGDTIYVGFRYLSEGDWNALCLDDIWFSRVHVPGECEPQGSIARRPELSFAPNPATGRFVNVQYDIAAGTRGNLTLRDVLGRTVKSFALDPSGSARLDLRGFATGVYMATLDAAGSPISRKLVLTTP